MKRLKTILLIVGISLVTQLHAGKIQYHHSAGLGGAWQGSIGGFGKYNARLNLFGNDTWTISLSTSPSIGAEIQRPDQDAFRPFFFLPSTADFNWGMGSSFDCLRYRGYSVKLGLAPSSFAAFDKSLFSRNIKSVPAYIAADFKFQTKNLRTFSFEVGAFVTQMNNSYLEDIGVNYSFNYFFGLY